MPHDPLPRAIQVRVIALRKVNVVLPLATHVRVIPDPSPPVIRAQAAQENSSE